MADGNWFEIKVGMNSVQSEPEKKRYFDLFTPPRALAIIDHNVMIPNSHRQVDAGSTVSVG